MIIHFQLRCGHTIDVTDNTLPHRSERRRNRQRATINDWWCRTCQGTIPIERQVR